MNMQYAKTKMILNNAKINFPCLFTASDYSGKYSVQAIIPNNHEQVNELYEIVFNAGRLKFGENFITPDGKFPECYSHPLKWGGESERYAMYENTVYFSATSRDPVPICDRMKVQIPVDDGRIRAGSICNLALSASGYDYKGNRGISLYLNAVQLVDSGNLNGRGNPLDAFKVLG